MVPPGGGEGTSAATLAERVSCVWSEAELQSWSHFQISLGKESPSEIIFAFASSFFKL